MRNSEKSSGGRKVRRHTKPRSPSDGRSPAAKPRFNPRVHPRLKPVLKEIGTPRPLPFTPDPFQIEALEKLTEGDVVVSVPTGAGKTYVALEAMAGLLEKGGRTWYASPLKALSNSKFFEFSQRFGPDRVGLLTGDHKVNPKAPIIVGTTEILRNQLYDAMSAGEDIETDLVVMDEAHYLGDPERGVVWEEVVIYLPPRVKLLLLSATVANTREIADWLAHVRGRKASTVVHFDRPVPLFPLFLFPDGELVPMTKGRRLFPQVKQYVEKRENRQFRNMRSRTPFGRTLRVLDEANLLPAILFLKSRADCDLALTRSMGSAPRFRAAQRTRLLNRLDELLEKYPLLKTHPHLKYLRDSGTAAHHAGHLPHWKLVIEQLMQEGLLAAIFSTSTVAAGVNFPARTVVLFQSDRFNGKEFMDLSATELLQMTGRAGRRGMDRIGFFGVVPGPFQNVQLVNTLFNSAPGPVRSQIQINFSMTLNLMLSHTPAEVKPLLNLSLAAYQRHLPDTPALKTTEQLTARLEKFIEHGLCSDPERALMLHERTQRLAQETKRLRKTQPRLAWDQFLRDALSPGRLFERKDGTFFCVIEFQERHGRPSVLAVRIHQARLTKNGRLKTKWVTLDRVMEPLATRLDISPDSETDEIVRLIRTAASARHDPLEMGRIESTASSAQPSPLETLEKRLEEIEDEIEGLPCKRCPLEDTCLPTQKSEGFKLISRLVRIRSGNQDTGLGLWASFMRHLEFLRAEGYVKDDELTDHGRWAAKLRLDHPLVIAAGIKMNILPEDDPVLLAALVAPFVVDSDRATEPPDSRHTVPPEL
ncbi:MAG: DEAD/DEAH box helicase, partial [Deltaproteobacteria bacterium]|nr:DEAD/DEAH box helicase [Deltaproteobacteria bacterium]